MNKSSISNSLIFELEGVAYQAKSICDLVGMLTDSAAGSNTIDNYEQGISLIYSLFAANCNKLQQVLKKMHREANAERGQA